MNDVTNIPQTNEHVPGYNGKLFIDGKEVPADKVNHEKKVETADDKPSVPGKTKH